MKKTKTKKEKPLIKLKNILFPTDFSDFCKFAASYAYAFALQYDASLYLIHVIEEGTLDAVLSSFPRPAREELLEAARRRMDEFIKETLPEEGKELRIESIITYGKPFVEIIKEAKEREIDMIVMGTHGMSALEHALLGSTTEKVVRKAPCPVLSIRLPMHKFVMPYCMG